MDDMVPLSENPDDFCFADTETRALLGLDDIRWGDVTQCGAARYGTSCRVVIFRYAIGNGPIQRWDLEEFDGYLDWDEAPADLREHRQRALKGEAWFVFWNSFFDRHVINGGMDQPTDTLLALPVRCVLDAMAQAVASNLPAKLDGAAKAVGHRGKLDQGKALIQLFAPANGGTPQTHPEEWGMYKVYADDDVDALRTVYFATRALWRWEWEEFWSSETINDRGLPIDKHFVERAAALATTYEAQVNDLVSEHTHGACWSVNQHVALANWVADAVEHLPEAADMLVKKYEEDEEGDGLVAASLSLARDRVEKLITYLERLDAEQGLTDEEFDVLQLLDVRLFGASATPKKFAKTIPVLDERDRVCGQYVFNGAQQTGRYSSRGIQVHNLTRAFVGMEDRAPEREAEAIEFICDMELQA
tara:strand:+ start:83 stop:1336 length:1254 start_codon:yes stop_codon:yes gene_type:complete